MTKLQQQYRGHVVDRTGYTNGRMTKWYPTYQQAYDAAAKLFKGPNLDGRWYIEVETRG